MARVLARARSGESRLERFEPFPEPAPRCSTSVGATGRVTFHTNTPKAIPTAVASPAFHPTHLITGRRAEARSFGVTTMVIDASADGAGRPP